MCFPGIAQIFHTWWKFSSGSGLTTILFPPFLIYSLTLQYNWEENLNFIKANLKTVNTNMYMYLITVPSNKRKSLRDAVKGCSTGIMTNGNFNQFSRSVDPGIFWAVIKFAPCCQAFFDHSAAEQWKSVDIYSILRHCTYSEVINKCLSYLQIFHSWWSSLHWKLWNSLFIWIRVNDHFVPAIFNILINSVV